MRRGYVTAGHGDMEQGIVRMADALYHYSLCQLYCYDYGLDRCVLEEAGIDLRTTEHYCKKNPDWLVWSTHYCILDALSYLDQIVFLFPRTIPRSSIDYLFDTTGASPAHICITQHDLNAIIAINGEADTYRGRYTRPPYTDLLHPLPVLSLPRELE